jgi:4-hydroxy-3-methylbut-2-en-1-yl diphosphate synthase IspG/GcpE
MRLDTVEVGGVRVVVKSIVIQSMTNTDTSDAKSTAKQIIELADLVRNCAYDREY